MNWLVGSVGGEASADALGGTCKGKCNRSTVNMGALAEASASDKAANNAGRVSTKLVSCVLRRIGGYVFSRSR
jgi:hypothetical protein